LSPFGEGFALGKYGRAISKQNSQEAFKACQKRIYFARGIGLDGFDDGCMDELNAKLPNLEFEVNSARAEKSEIKRGVEC
jgi:hypothetical protein